MGDAHWLHRQALLQQLGSVKRPRTEFELPPSGLTVVSETHSHPAQNEERGGPNGVRDINSLQSAYERYLQSSHSSSEEVTRLGINGLGRAIDSNLPTRRVHDSVTASLPQTFPELLRIQSDRDMLFHGSSMTDRVTRPREIVPLPPDASNTLYIEGLPSNCSKREVAHIFRPFVGYKEVRIVKKESKHPGGDPWILCFVDFADASCAATALTTLQGYKMDEEDPESGHLRLQFSKSPGPKFAPGAARARR